MTALRCLLVPVGALCLSGQTASEIVARSIERDSFNFKPPRDYVYTEESITRQFDSAGKVTKTDSMTREVMVLYDQPYHRLVSKDGKPLPAEKERSEQEKLDRAMAKRRQESPAQKAKREAAEKKQDAEDLACRLEFAKVFTFQLAGEEPVNGRAAWVVQAEPRAGADAHCGDNKMARKFHIKLWIDREEYRWARVEATSFEPVSFGVLVLRAAKGAFLSMEQTRIDSNTWMPAREHGRIQVKLALVKTLRVEETTTCTNYRKFQTDSRIVSIGQ